MLLPLLMLLLHNRHTEDRELGKGTFKQPGHDEYHNDLVNLYMCILVK